MADAILEGWIRKESRKAFTKDDVFIGEIRLHNVLCNQIPAAMLFQGYNQQLVRKGLLQMIDEGFAGELRAESSRRRMGRTSDSPVLPSESIGIEADVVLENWIRKESTKTAFSKEDTFIGEIRLHNILCNRIPAAMLGQGYTPQSVRKSLLKMIDEGFSEEMQEESRRRHCLEKSPDTATANPAGTTPGLQSEIYPDRLYSGVVKMAPVTQHAPSSSFSSTFKFGDPKPLGSKSQPTVSEAPTPPFCIQHGILTTLQSTLETACFKFSQAHCPSLLARRKWSCPHAGELNVWTKELRKSFDLGELHTDIPAPNETTRLTATLKEIDELRHTAVHRVPVSGARLVEFIKSAKAATKMLGDEQGVGEIDAIIAMVDSCFGEAVGGKVRINSALDKELVQLEVEKKKLERRELQIRQAAEEGAKKVEQELERSMVQGLEALKLHVHVSGGEF